MKNLRDYIWYSLFYILVKEDNIIVLSILYILNI